MLPSHGELCEIPQNGTYWSRDDGYIFLNNLEAEPRRVLSSKASEMENVVCWPRCQANPSL